MKVAAYIRVSTQEQTDSGAGLEAQRRALEAEAERRGWTIVGVYEDAGVSGKSVNGRIGLQEALDVVERGEAEALVVAKLDRLSRSLLDFAALMERARKQGWSLVALDLGVDTSTPSGELMANVLATFAQFERRLIGQRTKDALAAEAIGRIQVLHRDGLSLAGIARTLNEEGVETPRGGSRFPSGVKRVLSWTDLLGK